jgi:hypothetical protein
VSLITVNILTWNATNMGLVKDWLARELLRVSAYKVKIIKIHTSLLLLKCRTWKI